MNSQKTKVTIIFSISLLVLIGIVQLKNKERYRLINNITNGNYHFDEQSVFIVNDSVKNIHSKKECDSLLSSFINLNNTYKNLQFDEQNKTLDVETPFYTILFCIQKKTICLDTISIHTTNKNYCEN